MIEWEVKVYMRDGNIRYYRVRALTNDSAFNKVFKANNLSWTAVQSVRVSPVVNEGVCACVASK